MNVSQLQENLRRALWQRIEAGQLTGLKLAQDTGFQQAHVSNFLNRKRALSLEGMDRVLRSQKLSVLDLLDPAEVNKRASISPPAEEGFENVPLVDAELAAGEQLITQEHVRDIIKFKKSFLKRLRAEIVSDAHICQNRADVGHRRSDHHTPRVKWTRFVALKMPQDMSMYPRLLPGATLLVDRHYNSQKPYKRGERNIYAVRRERGVSVKYLEVNGATVVLRPHNQAYAVDIINVEAGRSYAEYLVGRVCYVGIEV